MSKSYDNYVGLAQAPEEQYGRTMSIPDELIEEWYRLASGLRGEELSAAVTDSRSEPYRAKRALAACVVELYHGGEAAARAADRFDLIHRQHGVPEDVEVLALSASDPELGAEGGLIWLPRLLVRAGLAPSTSQASRLLEQGAIAVDGTRVAERSATVPASGEYLLQKGKRHFCRIRFQMD